MMIMSLPPRDMLTFLVRGGGATCLKYASNAKLDQDHDMKRLFADQGRMEAAIIAYAKIGGERDCDVLDHAAYFSVVSALRIFYRCMEHNCAIFDLQTGKRFRSMEEFLTVLFLDEDTKAPQSDSIRAQHDRWAMIAEELNARMELIEKIKLALDEKAVLESALEFRINLGSTPQLLANARQCASIIRAELNGSWDTTSEGSELHENSLRSQWDKFRHHVDEQLMSVRDGDVPRLWRISKWFLRWQDHNVTAPSGMAAVKHDPFKGCNYIEAMSRAEKHSQNGRAAAFMREPGLFRLHADEMYRNCHNAFNLFAWPFTPLMDDSAQVRSMLRRVFFPSNGFYVFDARCETRVLRASDDLLLILIDIAERSGSQCNAVEAARFIMSTLTSNGIVGERRHILITGSAAAGKSTILTLCSKIVNGRGVSQSETRTALVYEPSTYLPPFKDEDSGFKNGFVHDTHAHLCTLFATQPHAAHDSDGGKDFKGTTAPVNTREVVSASTRQRRDANGSIVSAQEIGRKHQVSVHPTDILKATNVNPIDTGRAILSRLCWWLFPDGTGSRYEGASRAIFGQPENSMDMQYLRDLYALLFLAFHLLNCGSPYRSLFSTGAIESAFYGNINSPATDVNSPDTDVAVARRNRRKLRELNRSQPTSNSASSSTSSAPTSCMDMNLAIYLQFGLHLEVEGRGLHAAYLSRCGSELNGDFHIRFGQADVDSATRRFGVYLAGVKPASNSTTPGTGRIECEMYRKIRSQNTAGFVRSAIEHNYHGKSFDYYDILATYPWMSVPWDPDSALDVIRGVQMSEFFQPGVLQAARSVISLVLFALTKWPDTVKFNEKTGYITLERFFELETAIDKRAFEEEDAAEEEETKGRLIPGPDPSSLAGTRYEMGQRPKPKKLKRSASASTDENVDHGAMLRDLQEKNPVQMKHIKLFNSFCNQRYDSPEIPDDFKMSFRLMLMRAQSSSVFGDAPFIRSVGMDARADNKLEIHCMLFGLPFMLEQGINLLIHELRVPKVVLTYDVEASRVGQAYKRSPVAYVLFPRACDKQGFAAGSSYRSKRDWPMFPGLTAKTDKARVKQAFGCDEETELTQEEKQNPKFASLFAFERALEARRSNADVKRSYDDVDDDQVFVDAMQQQHIAHGRVAPVVGLRETLDGLVSDDHARANDFQRELNLGFSGLGVAIGALSRMQTLISQADLQSLQFAERYITNPNARDALEKLAKDASIDYQQKLGYRIASLAREALGDQRRGGESQQILDQIRTRMDQLKIADRKDSRVLSDYLYATGKYVTRVDVSELKDLRVVGGEVRCTDVIGSLEREWKSNVTEPVLFEPTVHDDNVIGPVHTQHLEDVRSSVYSCTDPWIRDKIPMSLSLVEEETTAVACQMIGHEYQPSHFTNYKRMPAKNDKLARIKFAVKTLRPLLAFSETLERTVNGELCYSNRRSDSSEPFMTASSYKGIVREMLMDFLDLMILFTQTTGLQSPYVDPSLCLYQSMLLGIGWMHSRIMSAAMLLYSSIDPEDIRIAYGLELDHWLDEVIAITPDRRRAILESRCNQFGSADYLAKINSSDEIDYSKNISRLMFYPLPSDKTPDTATIKQQFVISRRENKPDVYRVAEVKYEGARNERNSDEYVLAPKRKSPGTGGETEKKARTTVNEQKVPKRKSTDTEGGDPELENMLVGLATPKRKYRDLTLEQAWRPSEQNGHAHLNGGSNHLSDQNGGSRLNGDPDTNGHSDMNGHSDLNGGSNTNGHSDMNGHSDLNGGSNTNGHLDLNGDLIAIVEDDVFPNI
jgi:hypothetical protein